MLESLLLGGLGGLVAIAGLLCYRYILLRLDTYLKHHEPELWTTWGTGNSGLSRAAQFQRLRRLAIQHETNSPALGAMLESTSRWYFTILTATALLGTFILLLIVFTR
ncbi:MAG: hypothetical protein AAF513_15525 [Pseudomonadota bacterium]